MGYNGALRNNLFGQFSVQPTVGCASARRPRRSFDDHRTVHAISDDPGLVLAVVIWQPESHGMRDVCDNGLPESAFGDDVMGYNGALRNNLFGQFSVQPTVGCASARRPRRSFDDHRTVHAISDDPGLVLAVVIWQPESHGMRDVIVGDDVKPRTEVQCLDERGVHFSDRGAECLPRHRHTVHGGSRGAHIVFRGCDEIS